MNLSKFMESYVNHPVVFVGAGFSRRYLVGTYSWSELLKKIVYEMKGSHDFYFDAAGRNANSLGEIDLPKVASEIETEFNRLLEADRNGKFKRINDKYYEYAASGNYSASRMKIFISELVDLHQINDGDKYATEMELFAKASRNIGSVITTNYDRFIETLIGFNPIIGNDILLSTPYGSVYKIHGCVSHPESIVISDSDYERFKEEVINNLDKDFTYNVFNCSIMKIDKAVFIKRTNLLIIEGSYSLHPYFGKYYDLSVFLDIDTEKQIERIRNRDGETMLKNFIDKWIKYETLYHDFYKIKSLVDIYVK